MKISIIGLTITSSWGNGHATTFRSLVKGLFKAGHQVSFYERNVKWYETQRDMSQSPFCDVVLYNDLNELKMHSNFILNADLVMVGSYVPEGIEVGNWVVNQAKGIKVFYDIDTPVTLAGLKKSTCTYINPELIPQYDIFLSLSDGPALNILRKGYGAKNAVVFPCSVDEELYFPEPVEKTWDLGYLGTYSDDRQPSLEELLLKPASIWKKGKFVVAGSLYPDSIRWPENVKRINHLEPAKHRQFYNRQRFTLNLTRKDMIEQGFSPSVRIFEAAACGVPIISDWWEGIDQTLKPEEEILITDSCETTLKYLSSLRDDELAQIGEKARERILREHTSLHRARQLEQYLQEITEGIRQFE